MKYSSFRIIILLFLIASNFYNLSAQDVDINNLSNLNVEELSDEQIQKFIERVEAGGYTEDQLVVLARARGMSELQIQKLRQRIEEVRSGATAKSAGGTTGITRLRDPLKLKGEENEPVGLDPFASVFPEDTLKDKDELEIFGMSFFQSERSAFEPSVNVPTPKNYVIGPGDGIIIDIWGAFEYTYDLTVSPEGVIRIADVGPIQVSGLSVDEASNKIKQRLKSIYSTLGQNAFADVSLGQIRTINVNVVGEVKIPGSYSTTSFSTAFNALYLAGGPNESGSLRVIDVFRSGKKVATLDAYDYLIRGGGSTINLQDEDVIIVRPYINRVSIYGEVKRPAIYELMKGETLAEMIEYAGGFTGDAYSERISIRRNSGNFRAVSTVENDRFSTFEMKNGDMVEVKPISNLYSNRVIVQGAVFQAGEYELEDSLTLKSLIQKAGGLRGDAFMGRAVILRKNEDFSLANVSVNLKELFEKPGMKVWLENEDIVRIQSIYDLREEFFVQIQGEVIKPGKYPYVHGQTVEDLILLAGGFKPSAARSFVEISRRNAGEDEMSLNKTAEIYNFPISSTLTLNESASSFSLEAYDLVVIRKSPYFEEQITVEVSGEVLFPGMYALSSKDERISDIIERSGGLTAYAYPKGATLIRRTEYYQGEEDKKEREEEENLMEQKEGEIANIRREELKNLLQRDTLLETRDISFKEQESIGINLEEIMKKPGSEYDLIMKEGDILSIPRELQTVRIRGEVLYPSNVRYSKSFAFRDFVSQAGGFTDDAKKKNVYVIYPNGTAERTKSFLWFKDYPKVEPGAEIIIPGKPNRRRLSAGEIVGLSSGVATLSLVILRLVDYIGN